MRVSRGVEWALHTVMLLAQAPAGSWTSRRTIADFYDLPDPYLAKYLKRLVSASILLAVTGPRGGYRLAAPPEKISALSVFEAIEGSGPAFVCEEIRCHGTGAAHAGGVPAHMRGPRPHGRGRRRLAGAARRTNGGRPRRRPAEHVENPDPRHPDRRPTLDDPTPLRAITTSAAPASIHSAGRGASFVGGVARSPPHSQARRPLLGPHRRPMTESAPCLEPITLLASSPPSSTGLESPPE